MSTATRPYAVCSTNPCIDWSLMTDTTYPGDPNGKVDGYPGRQCWDNLTFKNWKKTTPVGVKTGWV